MIAPEAEVYFPLSKNLLLFMYFKGRETDNPLRKLKVNSVIEATDEMHDWITSSKIMGSVLRYFVLGEDYTGVNVATL